jgi:hypothetical protein
LVKFLIPAFNYSGEAGEQYYFIITDAGKAGIAYPDTSPTSKTLILETPLT